METLRIFNYNETPITFRLGDTTMVNATEMAKPFGNAKQPVHWLNNQQTKEFLSEFSKLRILSLADLVKVTKGGNNPGTWMHEDVALEFARWLSPLFAIWCNDRIKELLRISSLVHNDTSRNILPGVHSPKAKMIGEHSIWTICLDDMLYYRLKDILNAINIYEHKRKETSKNWFKSYIYWINDQTGTVLHRYIKEPGVLFLISKTRTTKDNPSAQQFLTSFTRQAEKCRMQKTLSEDTWPETIEDTSRKEIDLNKFLDLTITIQDNDTRNFFFSVYKRLKG